MHINAINIKEVQGSWSILLNDNMLLITHNDTTQLQTNCLVIPIEKIVMWVFPRDGNWLLLGTDSYFISTDITTVPGGQWYCQGNDWILWPYNPFHESVWIGIWREIIGKLAHTSSWNCVNLGILSHMLLYICTCAHIFYFMISVVIFIATAGLTAYTMTFIIHLKQYFARGFVNTSNYLLEISTEIRFRFDIRWVSRGGAFTGRLREKWAPYYKRNFQIHFNARKLFSSKFHWNLFPGFQLKFSLDSIYNELTLTSQ